MPHFLTALVGLFALSGVSSSSNTEVNTCEDYGNLQYDNDLAGDELAEKFALAASDCCSLCDATDGCEGFSYSAQWQKCYLKSNLQGTYANTGIVAQLKKKIPASCSDYSEEMKDTDVGGDMLSQQYAASVDGCCGLCDAADGCEGFSYSAQWQKCYLKSNLQGTYHSDGIVAQLKTGPSTSCSNYTDEMDDVDLAGGMLSQQHAATSDDCCGLCDVISNCQGFTFYQSVCYLKGDVVGTYGHAGRVTRIKSATQTEFAV